MQSDTINIGILAHVDAGKTTLSEAILYRTGSIRKLGRVDHGDTFLDTHAVERERGITIFSKQAVFRVGDMRFCFLDTPGHVDFSAEMERTLCVLDYAILVISGVEGIQGHTETVWRLLGQYRTPVLVFVNKMDRDGADRERMMEQLRRKFNENCLCFSDGFAADGEKPPRFSETLAESIAACDEELLDCYLDGGAAAFGEAADPFLALVKEKIEQSCPELFMKPLEIAWDYVYDRESLATLKGKKLHGKRNHINKFMKTYPDFEYKKLDTSMIAECLDLYDEWSSHKDETTIEAYDEKTSVCLALKNMDALGLTGGCIVLEGQIVAFTVGERLLPHMQLIHIEKANYEIEGLYPVINQQYVLHECQGVTLVNREEDMGIEGMRKAKHSYQPVKMIKKYFISTRELKDDKGVWQK